jgi:hypothetical protein
MPIAIVYFDNAQNIEENTVEAAGTLGFDST